MTIFFTLCANNYLANALSLNQSFRKYHPDIKFVIGLVDKPSSIAIPYLKGYELLYVDDLNDSALESMKTRYNIIELSTAVKPYYIDHFFSKLKADKVIYLDPDTLLFAPITEVINELNSYTYILTPHAITPKYDSLLLSEQITLITGTFNLGFFAIKNNLIGNQLIDWWKQKLYDECILDMANGYFVDQKWMNLSICYFDNFLILKNIGINMAHWNFHERVLNNTSNKYLINENIPLVLFHYSSYKPETPDIIARWQNRFTLQSRPDLKEIFYTYSSLLATNHYNLFKDIKPCYGVLMNKKVTIKERIKNKLITYLSKI